MKKYGDNPISTGKKPAKVPKKAAKQVKDVKAKKPASKTGKPS
jgi:hypothetical protein